MNARDNASSSNRDILFGPVEPEILRNEVLADILTATAERIPDKTALIFGDRQLSFGQLYAQAQQVAQALTMLGVRPGQIVGLWLPRGIDLLVMQAGIALAGAAWLPVDEDIPVERLAVCLEDANSPGVVTCNAMSKRCEKLTHTVWTAESLLERTNTSSVELLRAQPEDPAYVIYTSGSTGKPKGIAITQASICHFLRSENAVLGVREDDRVYQGFSVAFDMSFEEIWISYLVGATLWIAPKDLTADPEALPLALNANRVTVLHAVPTLLSLFAHDVPSLRIINLGGEMCPESLVERWDNSVRKIFNTYGPTEATVSASLAQLHAGEPVTIGVPLPNYGLLVIDTNLEQGLKLLPRGETGELCIIGPGLAAGYLGRPELTAEKFLENPWTTGPHDQRLYRTGDLARIAEDGKVQCLGRADDQVKIRGFRVELGEIEAALSEQPGVGTTAVLLRNLDGIDQLIAYLVPENEHMIDPVKLRDALTHRLPPYMVPGRYEVLDAMPRLTSGKIDRKALKAMPLQIVSMSSEDSDVASNPAEEALFATLVKLFPGQAIRRDADFFSDLGGHSFFAARLASGLRTDPRFAHITVRDIYQLRLIGKIAARMQEAAIDQAVDTSWTPPPAWKRWGCGLAQAVAIPCLVTFRMVQWLAPFFTYHFLTGEPSDSVAVAIAASVGVFLLATLSEFVITIIAKRIISIGIRPGRYPLWGITYFRWWLTDRLIDSSPVYLLSGSSLYVWWLRALGAKVGHDVIVGSITIRAPEFLTIADRASIGNAVNLENARVERGQLVLGTISIGADACIGSYTVLEGGTQIGAYGHLEGQSALAEGMSVPANRVWGGSPARDMGQHDLASLPPRPPVTKTRLTGEAVYFAFGVLLVATLFFIPVFPTFVLIDWLDEADILPWLQSDALAIQLCRYLLFAFPASLVLVACTAVISAGIRWSVMPRLKPGRWPIHSKVYCGKWFVSQIQESCLNVLHGIYATVYAPFWYRLLGAKVGRDAEISTALGVVPDMLTLGDETFIADAVMLGDEEIDGGWITMKATTISHRSFVGNGSYIPDGTTLPENVLIGVHSRAPDNDKMQDGDTWLGSPPISLPAREKMSGFPERLTFHPSPMRRLGRGLVEAFRIAAPHAIVIAVGYTLVLDLMPLAGAGRWWDVGVSLSVAGFWYGLGSFGFVALLKWIIIGRYEKRAVPMWSPFVWLSEGITNLYEGIAVPNFMRNLRGTPWLPLAFNLLGCKIGRGVYLDTTDITEFDCASIGEYSEINALACPQTHLFEDRVMKIDRVKIGARVYMGARSFVLYSAEVGDNARLGPLTLVMKGENIPAATSWTGCPAAPHQERTQPKVP